jgi:hypothetical protein
LAGGSAQCHLVLNPLWRRHSCLPRRHSCRRLVSQLAGANNISPSKCSQHQKLSDFGRKRLPHEKHKPLHANVLLDLKIFAACDDLWGGPPGPRPTPPSARFWLRLGCSVGQALSPANSAIRDFSRLLTRGASIQRLHHHWCSRPMGTPCRSPLGYTLERLRIYVEHSTGFATAAAHCHLRRMRAGSHVER